MKDTDSTDISLGDGDSPDLYSEDVELEGPGDSTIGPIPPELRAWRDYELDRIKNPTKPASMPRPAPYAPQAVSPGAAGTPLWQKVRGLTGRTLRTADRSKEFKVEMVQDDYLVVKPRDGKPRFITSRRIDQVTGLRLKDDELTLARLRKEFPQNRNLSYILAIVCAIS